MNCFDKLYESNFLKMIGKEISTAQSAVGRLASSCPPLGSLPGKRIDKKNKYNAYLNLLGFRSELSMIDPNDYETLYYMKEGSIVLLCAKSKTIIDIATQQSLKSSGDIPFYRSKLKINNAMYYTAMYDLLFRIQPITNN